MQELTQVADRPSPWWAGWRAVGRPAPRVIAGGTAGYTLIEGWIPWDAFYMTVISVTTVGYREIHPLSRAARSSRSIVLMVGVATVLYTFSFFMARLVEGDLQARWTRRRRERMLDDLDNHFIICGFGRIGPHHRRASSPASGALRHHRARSRPHAGGDRSRLSRGRGRREQRRVLRARRHQRARGFIAAVSTDAENVYAVLTARLLHPDLFIIGRAETEDAQAKLVRAGADRVISPYQIGGLQLAQTALRPAVVDFVQLATSSDNLDLEHGAGADCATARRSPADASSRPTCASDSASIVVGIQRADGRMEFNPPPGATMRAGDYSSCSASAENLRELEAARLGERASVHAAPACDPRSDRRTIADRVT